MAALVGADNKARQALAKAERSPKTTPEQLAALQQRVQETQDQLNQSVGPPPKPTNVFGGPNVGGDLAKTHQAALAEHQALVDARVHAEGTTPETTGAGADKIFAMANQTVVRGADTAGNAWVGTGHVMVRGNSLDRAAAQTAKLKTSTSRTVDPGMLDKVVKPDPKVTYQPVTWEREVAAPEVKGTRVVIGTTPDGTHVTLQKPVYHALIGAAGPGGTIVAAPKVKGKSGGDDRLFARNAQGETMGVGMPVRSDQAQTRVFARGSGQPTPGTAAAAAPPAAAVAAAPPNLPPVPDGHVRLYHGGANPTSGGSRWVTPHYVYARDYRKGQPVQYVDVPRDHPAVQAATDTEAVEGTGMAPPIHAFNAPEDIAKQLRPVEPANAGAAPGRQADLLADQDTGTSGPVEDASATVSDISPFPRGRYLPKDVEHYKLNDGTSVYRSVFTAAGVDPDLAVNRPLAWQNKVLSDHLKDHFGFRNVTVASGVNPMFARDTMLEMTRAAQDMAHALGMRPQLISLDGRLAFQIEPRGKREYFGAYDGGTKTIHLVNDANSFGHEWIHALDHHLTEQLLNNPALQNLLSRHTREGVLDTRDGTQAAFAKLINTMFYDEGAAALHRINLEQQAARVDRAGNPTRAAQEAQRNLDALDKGASRQQIQPSQFRQMAAQFGKPSYWASAHEMLARTGEAWIARQMENNGVDPRGVVMPDEAYLNATDRRLKMTFPKDAERMAIFAAYTDLFDRLKNDGIITGPTAPKADFPAATIGWARQTTPAQQRSSLGQAVRRELNGLSIALQKLRHPVNELTGGDLRPAAPKGLTRSTRAADQARTFLYSYGAHMKVIIARNAGPGGRALQAIYDKLSPDPGSGRAVGETFGEEHRALDNRLRNQMGRIFENNGISNANQMTAMENAMIHHVMTTGEATYQGLPVPANLVKIAGQLQNEMLNPLYRELTNTGHEVGVAPNGYFPRIYDEHAIYSDPQGFHAAAMQMHQVMFDKDVGAPGDDPVRLLERWRQLTKAERAAIPPTSASVPVEMKALRKNLREQAKTQEALAASPNDPTLQAQLAQLKTEAEQLARDNHDLVRDHVADLAASDWRDRILKGDPLDFETMGPSGRFLNRRVLPPEADQIMAKYMHIDPRVALPRYFDSVSRRIVWTRLFGKEDKFLQDQIQKATDAGVSGPDLQRFQSLVNQATGRLTYKANRDVQKANQQLHAMGAVLLMSRSAWSSLAEPINAAMATGEMKAAWHSFANQFASVFRTASARERAEIGDMLGITTSSAYDSIMQARTGAEYSDSPGTDRFMTAFYKASLLTQLTTAQRRAAVGTSDWLLRKWSRDLLNRDPGDRAADRRDDAERMFKELGLTSQGNNLRDQFANWMLSHDGPVPATELQSSEFRGVYGLAVRRLVDRMIQSPYKIDRPQLSGVPMLSLATQLMSFNYAYVKNILEPMAHRIGHAWTRGYERSYERAKAGGAGDFGAKARGFAGGARGFSRAAIAAGVTVAATILASMLTSVPRQYIFDQDNWQKHAKTGDLGEWLFGLGVSRSGIAGTFDPLAQVIDSLRYTSDLSSLWEGATPAYILRNAKDLITPWVGQAESPNSNTQYHNQARAFYNLIMQPLEVIGLTMMNAAGGPALKGVTSAMMQYLTSPKIASSFADVVAGPKGSTLETGADDDPAGAGVPGIDGLEEPDGKPIQPGGMPQGGATNAALGLADDVAAPLFKALQKPWNVLPGPAKVVVAGLMTALYGIHWWNETAPWRDHPKTAPAP